MEGISLPRSFFAFETEGFAPEIAQPERGCILAQTLNSSCDITHHNMIVKGHFSGISQVTVKLWSGLRRFKVVLKLSRNASLKCICLSVEYKRHYTGCIHIYIYIYIYWLYIVYVCVGGIRGSI